MHKSFSKKKLGVEILADAAKFQVQALADVAALDAVKALPEPPALSDSDLERDFWVSGLPHHTKYVQYHKAIVKHIACASEKVLCSQQFTDAAGNLFKYRDLVVTALSKCAESDVARFSQRLGVFIKSQESEDFLVDDIDKLIQDLQA